MALERKGKSVGMRQKKSIAVIINGNWSAKGIRNNNERNHHSTAPVRCGVEGGSSEDREMSEWCCEGLHPPDLIQAARSQVLCGKIFKSLSVSLCTI